jgi:3-hydroxyacyl-CoA dehydrogenase
MDRRDDRIEAALADLRAARLDNYRLPPDLKVRLKAGLTAADAAADPALAAQLLALHHIAEAERNTALIPDIPAGLPTRKIETAAIIGAGTMGGGIAMSLASAGIRVTVLDNTLEALDRGLGRVRDNYAVTVSRGRLDQSAMDARLSLIRGTLDMNAIAAADLVIEAVFEELTLKQDIFKRIDQIARPGAILATNTSGLDIDAIAAVTARPQDVAGAHFFSPANVMRLLEVVRAEKSAKDVIATLMALGRKMDKVAVLARVYDGFIGNALLRHYAREAQFLLEEGALPHQVDQALTEFGFAMGIFAVHDLAGNDVGYQTRKKQMATRPKDRRYADLIMTLCDMGRLGQKSGAGWYRYAKGSRAPIPDPTVEALIIERSKEIGVERRPISDEAIIKRTLYGMINEGARLLELGIALRASDIDIVYLTGYGFPAWRGGPMYYADAIGLDRIHADVKKFHAEHGYWWQPAPLLEQLARSGKTFAEYDAEHAAARRQ